MIELTRYKQAAKVVRPNIKRHLDHIKAEIQSVDTDFNQKIKEHSLFDCQELIERFQ